MKLHIHDFKDYRKALPQRLNNPQSALKVHIDFFPFLIESYQPQSFNSHLE